MFKPRLGPIINQEWTTSVISQRLTEEDKSKPIPPVPLNFRNAALKRMLAEESPETQAEVETWRQSQHIVEAKGQGDGDEESCRLAAANQYHK